MAPQDNQSYKSLNTIKHTKYNQNVHKNNNNLIADTKSNRLLSDTVAQKECVITTPHNTTYRRTNTSGQNTHISNINHWKQRRHIVTTKQSKSILNANILQVDSNKRYSFPLTFELCAETHNKDISCVFRNAVMYMTTINVIIHTDLRECNIMREGVHCI